MATTTASQQAAAPSTKPGRLKRILVIVLVALVVAGAAGGATWFFMSRHAVVPGVAPKPAPAPAPRAPIYYALEPITVNLQSDDGETHYLRVGLTLKLDSQATQDVLVEHMPEIRSRILLALSNKRPEDLAPLEGKRALATELAALISQPTDPREKPARIDGVLFTDFVVQ